MEETEVEVDSAEVAEAVTQVSVVVEVGAEVTSVAVAVVVVEAAEISEVAVGTLEVEVEEALTAVEVVGVAVGVALGNREGTWFFLSIFPSNLIQNTVYSLKMSRQLWTLGLQTSLKMNLSSA